MVSENPYEVEQPDSMMLNDFSKLIIVNILRPESLIQGITQYVINNLG
jgi:hypothetical protein